MVVVLRWGRIINEDIVGVHNDNVGQVVSEYFIHKTLEDGGSVGQSKRHYPILIVPSWSYKRCLPFITPFNTHQVVGAAEIQFGENPSTTKLFQGSRDQRKGITVFDGLIVESPVVNTGAQPSSPELQQI